MLIHKIKLLHRFRKLSILIKKAPIKGLNVIFMVRNVKFILNFKQDC